MTGAKRISQRMAQILESMPSWEVRKAAQRLIDVAEDNGAFVKPGICGFSIRFPEGPGWQKPISVAWLYPGESGWSKAKYFSFGRRTQGDGPENLPGYANSVLEDWAKSLGRLSYADSFTAKNVDVWVVSHHNAVKHLDELAELLGAVLSELKAVHSEDLEDYYMAEEVMERVRKGEVRTHSSAEVRADLGLDS